MKDYSVEELKSLSLYEFCLLFWGYGSEEYANRVSDLTNENVDYFIYAEEEWFLHKYKHAFNMVDYVITGNVHKDNVQELCNFIENLPDAIVKRVFEEISQGGSQWSVSLSGK